MQGKGGDHLMSRFNREPARTGRGSNPTVRGGDNGKMDSKNGIGRGRVKKEMDKWRVPAPLGIREEVRDMEIW
jgi:hypothetical protein